MGFRNVFVLSTGRCGSTTFARAAAHSTNYDAAHESRAHLVGEARLAYPASHIEVDNRLSWFLGRLGSKFGDDAMYVHLKRDRAATAESFTDRLGRGSIMGAYSSGIVLAGRSGQSRRALAEDYVDTVTANIDAFLAGRPHTQTIELESIKPSFEAFWERIGAAGDLAAALAEWDTQYNARARSGSTPAQVAAKLRRLVSGIPHYLRTA